MCQYSLIYLSDLIIFFSKLTKRGALTEFEIKEAMREVRVALLEADVNYSVVKQFIAETSEAAVGEKVLKSLAPGQQVLKIVRDKLTELMGSENAKLEVSSKPPTVIMLCGLQGSGKNHYVWQTCSYAQKNKAKDPYWLHVTFIDQPQ